MKTPKKWDIKGLVSFNKQLPSKCSSNAKVIDFVYLRKTENCERERGKMQRFGVKLMSSFQNPRFLHGFQRLLLHSSANSSSNSIDLFANDLVSSLGFSHKQALSTSIKFFNQNLKLNDQNISLNANPIICFFKDYGFDETQIRRIVSANPSLFNSKFEKTLKPKFDFFKDEGFPKHDVISLISRNSNILLRSLDSSIVPTIRIFREVLINDAYVISALMNLRFWSSGVIVNLLPNVNLLSSYGIPTEIIRKHLIRRPTTFLRKPEIFRDLVNRVEKSLGIGHDSPLFINGIYLVSSFSVENIEAKFQMFYNFGWTRSDVDKFIMKNPTCFMLSEASIKKKMEFFKGELGYDPAYLTGNNFLLTCSLEKRVVPRHKVMSTLKEKGLVEKIPAFSSIVHLSEPAFLKKFVLPFVEVHEVYVKHTGGNLKTLMKESEHSLLQK